MAAKRLLGLEDDIAVVATVATALLGIEVGLALAASPLQGMARGMGRFDLIVIGAIFQATISVGLVLVLTAPLGLIGAALALVVGRAIGVIAVLRGVANALRKSPAPTLHQTGSDGPPRSLAHCG